MESESLPHYTRIALDIASRIAAGEIEEHQKISGRSMLSSEYNASSETIRKAIKLLSDMKVVDVQEKKGVLILSADNARRYVQSFASRQEQLDLCAQLRELLEQQAALSKRVSSVAEQLVNAQAHPLPAEKRLPNYEVKVDSTSDKIGRDLASLKFWQATGATIIAIRRSIHTILSPGPFAQLYDGDIVVFVGAPESVFAVQRFLNGSAPGEAIPDSPAP